MDALEDTSESLALNIDDTATGRNTAISDGEETGTNEAIGSSATGVHSAVDIEQALAATGEMPTIDITDTSATLADTGVETDVDFDSSLLDATGQTQILPEDFAVETGTGTNIERALADDEATMLAPSSTTADAPARRR